MSVVSAPSPEAKARQCLAPSRPARHSSSAARVGLPERPYSKPLCLPTPCWAKVVAMWMGWTTAPVAGSGPWPMCSARVENPHSLLLVTSPPRGEVAPAGVGGWGAPLSLSPTAVRDELEQVRARDHGHRLAPIDHEHRLLATQQWLECVVE